MDDSIIAAAKDYIRSLFGENCDGHDAEHSLRVYRNALEIAAAYPGCNKTVVELAALLHDADDHKLFDTVDNSNARRFLKEHDIDDDTIEFICTVINGVSFSRNKGVRPDSTEGQIVQDADRLDAIGAVGIARAFAYGGRAGRPLSSTIQHFSDKLLLLKDGMNTKEARLMAESRHKFMTDFLSEYNRET